MNFTEKLTKILFAVFIMVFSITVLTQKIPETKYIQNSINHLEETQKTVMAFSGATIATSLAMSALPEDFANPLAETIADLNTYFVFMFAVIFIEKLIVIEGIQISLSYIIPAACLLYMASVLTTKEMFHNFAKKLLILGISLIVVIPFSTHFTETVCDSYLEYVDKTIEEADAGAAKINDIMSTSDEDATFFDKLSNAFKTAIQTIADLLTYFRNILKKCVTAVAILLVTTFLLPVLILMFFRWLLTELFALHIPLPKVQIRLPHHEDAEAVPTLTLFSKEDDDE